MATAWRPADDPLRRYIASVSAGSDTRAAAGAGVEQHEHEHEEEAAAPPVLECDCSASSQQQQWARWRGRLARQGILIDDAGSPSAPRLPRSTKLLGAVLVYQLTLRSAIRQLQGPMALLCGRGVSVPMPPLQPSLVEKAEKHCPALPALRAALVSSVARAASALLVRDAERSAAGPVDNGSILLHSLTAVAEEAAKKGTAGLLQVQAAAQTWTVLAGGALREEAGWNEAAVVGALEAEQAFLAEAFGLEPDAAAAGEDGDEREISNGDQRQPIQEEQERRRERVRRRLRAMGRRAAVGRASAESLLGRLFLRQCAVAEALRRLEGDGDSEWLERLVEGRMVGGEPEDDAEEALLRAMGVDVRGEAAALAAAWREKDDDGEGEQRLGRGERFDRPSASVVGDEDEEEEEECGGTSEGVGGEQGQAAVVFDSCGGDREECPDRGGSGSPTTSVESQQQEEDVLEVFEGTAKSPGWEEQQAAGDGRRQQQEEQHQQLQQGSLLFGELSRVLQGRQQRGQGKIVKVNGQRTAALINDTTPPPPIVKLKEKAPPPVAMLAAQGAAALAAGMSGLQEALLAQRGKSSVAQEEEVFGEGQD